MKLTKTLLTLCLLMIGTGVMASPDAYHRVHGAYVGTVDITPLGFPAAEEVAVILHKDGTATFISEHEPNDTSTSGLGVWKQKSKRHVALGLHLFRVGLEGACPILGVLAPENCVLRLGAKLKRVSRNKLVGGMTLTVEARDGEAVTLPGPLDFELERMRLTDYPGAID